MQRYKDAVSKTILPDPLFREMCCGDHYQRCSEAMLTLLSVLLRDLKKCDYSKPANVHLFYIMGFTQERRKHSQSHAWVNKVPGSTPSISPSDDIDMTRLTPHINTTFGCLRLIVLLVLVFNPGNIWVPDDWGDFQNEEHNKCCGVFTISLRFILQTNCCNPKFLKEIFEGLLRTCVSAELFGIIQSSHFEVILNGNEADQQIQWTLQALM